MQIWRTDETGNISEAPPSALFQSKKKDVILMYCGFDKQ